MSLSCSKPRPSGVLSQDEMVNLLIDVHLLQAELQVRNYIHEDAEKLFGKVLSDSIAAKQGWTIDEVQHSLDYYMEDVPTFTAIYQRVLDSLSLKQSLSRFD